MSLLRFLAPRVMVLLFYIKQTFLKGCHLYSFGKDFAKAGKDIKFKTNVLSGLIKLIQQDSQ